MSASVGRPRTLDHASELAALRAQLQQEVAERARVEEALRQLQKALETTQLGVTITDTSRKIVYANPADARMHGYAVEDLIGRDVGIYAREQDRRPLAADKLGSMSNWRRDSTNVRKDGTTFPVRLISDVVVGAGGEPIGVVTTCEDITERVQAEEQLRAAYEDLDRRVMERTAELSEANARLREQMAERRKAVELRRKLEGLLRQAQKMEALGQFTGGIAHDFNNLLTVILANAELVSRSLPAGYEHLKADLDELESAASKGRNMVKKLLGFSRRQALTLESLDLAKLLGDVGRMLGRLVPENIEVEISFDGPVGRVQADPGAIEQIVINLATNARDAMPEGGVVRIGVYQECIDPEEASARPGAEAGDYARIRVSDTGVGMDERTQEHIFEPFFTTKAPGEGSGLGMAMVYGLVEQHGGFVEVHSREGRGTTVAVYLPAAREESGEAPPVSQLDELVGGSETILLVEDEECLRAAGRRILEQFGYTVVVASDGETALDLMEDGRGRLDLVIADVMLPGMSGFELWEAAGRAGHTAPFLFTSGYTGREGRATPTPAADVPFLPKPWTLTELVTRVRAVLDAVHRRTDA